MKNVLLVMVAFAWPAQEPGPWRLVIKQGERLFSLREDGSGRRDEAALAPDGKRRLYISIEDGDAEIWISDLDGKNPRKLTDNKEIDNTPLWTPDGKRIVFASTRSGTWQIWIMYDDGSNPVQLTQHADGARDPRISPAGDRISYLELHPEPTKLPPSSLRTMDLSGEDSKVLLEKTQILGHSWSPKGDRLACGLVQKLQILEWPSGKPTRTFELAEIHKDIHAHSAFGMLWRPDGGAVACTITFLGGRMAGSKIFGDDQVFILPMEGKPVVIEAGGPAGPVRWTR